MHDSWDVTEDGEEDVDEEVGVAASFEEDTDGWEEDGKDDLANIASCEGHCWDEEGDSRGGTTSDDKLGLYTTCG